MLKLKDIMQQNVISVSPDLTLRELLGVLTEHGVSGAPVVAAGKVVGVISATGVLEFQGTIPGVPVARAAAADDTEWAAERIEESMASPSEFFLNMWAPAEIDALERMRTADSPEWDVLDEHTVADAMSRAVVSRPGDTSVKAAAAYMLESGVHRLLVLDKGELHGIVSTTDIVRAVVEGKLKG